MANRVGETAAGAVDETEAAIWIEDKVIREIDVDNDAVERLLEELVGEERVVDEVVLLVELVRDDVILEKIIEEESFVDEDVLLEELAVEDVILEELVEEDVRLDELAVKDVILEEPVEDD